jgi:hypothetical protein
MRYVRLIVVIVAAALCQRAFALLPANAIDLSKLKISEKQKSEDLCPVHLVPSKPDGPKWEYEGVKYRGSTPDAKDVFRKEPAKYVEAHKEKLWENNFIESMSRIWCPVTDQVNPGGLEEWFELDIHWESCCTFCSQTVSEEHFPAALERLKRRALESYKLSGGKYVEGAASPVEGAIRSETELAALTKDAKLGAVAASDVCNPEPAWLKGAKLEPTYNGGVATIFANRCLRCHRPGGLSPVDFTTYQSVRNWTKNMQASLVSGAMPPWPADPAVGCFSNALTITQKEKDVLFAWINAQFPRGEGAAPAAPMFSEWNIGEPDEVLTLPEYVVPKDTVAEYKELVLETSFPEDRWIVASELRAEDPFLVVEVDAGPLGTFYPGNPFETLPDGVGRLLKAGEKVSVRVRYVKEAGFEAQDETKIALKFGKADAIKQKISDSRVAQTELKIPAGAEKYEARAEYTVKSDSKLVSMLPNLRERGNRLTISAALPGGETTQLLNIPRWRYKWRMRYQLRDAIELPKGTVVTVAAVYDNSAKNTDNPDPEAEVKADATGETLECWLGLVPK